MEHLMNELVSRSIVRERERDLALALRVQEGRVRRVGVRPRSGPPRPRPGATTALAHA